MPVCLLWYLYFVPFLAFYIPRLEANSPSTSILFHCLCLYPILQSVPYIYHAFYEYLHILYFVDFLVSFSHRNQLRVCITFLSLLIMSTIFWMLFPFLLNNISKYLYSSTPVSSTVKSSSSFVPAEMYSDFARVTFFPATPHWSLLSWPHNLSLPHLRPPLIGHKVKSLPIATITPVGWQCLFHSVLAQAWFCWPTAKPAVWRVE